MNIIYRAKKGSAGDNSQIVHFIFIQNRFSKCVIREQQTYFRSNSFHVVVISCDCRTPTSMPCNTEGD